MSRIRPFERWRKRQKFRKRKKLCRNCGERDARFIRRKQKKKKVTHRLGRKSLVKTDRSHDLCPRCNRSLTQSAIVRRLFSPDI